MDRLAAAASPAPAATVERGASGVPADERRKALVRLYRSLAECHECPLAETRTHLVFGNGNADADLMFVGEAPGFHEDQQARPFVGRAGKLLDQLLGEIGLTRADVFVTNVLMCRPPGNRDPLPHEIEECTPYLMEKIALIEPRVICTLGNFATKLLTGSQRGITRVHGRPQDREVAGRSVRLYAICHPAAALRSDAMRTQLREDFHRLPALLAEPRPEPAASPPLDGPAEPAIAAVAAEPASQLGLFGSA